MPVLNISEKKDKTFSFLASDFNKKKFSVTYGISNDPILNQIQNMARRQCTNNKDWPLIDKIKAWMITAETATFMKCGGLGMVASELPENFDNVFASEGHNMVVITPLYVGFTGKKKATFENDVYCG